MSQMSWRLLFLVVALSTAPARAATLLVANKSEASVALLQLPQGDIVATLPTGEGPHEVAVSPDGRRAVISDYGSRNRPGRTLTVVDVVAARISGTIELPAGARPHGVEWLDERRVLVTAEGLRSLLLLDMDKVSISETIAIDQDVTHMVAASATLGRAFVANIGSGTATVVDLGASVARQHLAGGAGSEGIALARAASELWLTNREADTVSVFSTDTLEKLATIDMAGFPIRAEADDARGLVYITLPRADALVAVDTQTRRVRRRIHFDIGPDRSRKTLFGSMLPDSSIPVGVMLSGDGGTLFVAHSNAHVISVYDAQTLQRTALFVTGLEPDGMAWSPLDVKR